MAHSAAERQMQGKTALGANNNVGHISAGNLLWAYMCRAQAKPRRTRCIGTAAVDRARPEGLANHTMHLAHKRTHVKRSQDCVHLGFALLVSKAS
jgi:hypothetical protein